MAGINATIARYRSPGMFGYAYRGANVPADAT
jgi:hypothetical protein